MRIPLASASLAAALLLGCRPEATDRIQGYIEGEFVYVASPRAGSLRKLETAKGTRGRGRRAALRAGFDAGDDRARRGAAEARSRDRAARGHEEGQAADGDRVRRRRARAGAAALVLSESELARQEKLRQSPGATTERDLDLARAARDRDRQRVAQLTADLDTARLGSREDQIAAAEADVRSSQAALATAEWELGEKRQLAPRAGLVFDTLYREGDWVGAGLPVVVLLPPSNVKLRVFVGEEVVGALHLGDAVQVFVDGVSGSSTGKVSFIAPRAEYTPPVVYSRENRRKFVFMVEAVFEPEVAKALHPGQPVEVELGARRP
jgi:HlyD family secretion protein